jgi:hypothetical protein
LDLGRKLVTSEEKDRRTHKMPRLIGQLQKNIQNKTENPSSQY